MQNKRIDFIKIAYFTLYLVAAITISYFQPMHNLAPDFPNPPDEHSRYMVPLYICNHGTLPTGFEEELFGDDVRWTYGFYTLLPYMIQGYAMRLVSFFTNSDLAFLYTARLVNVIFGFIMAVFVMKIGFKLFSDKNFAWLFSFLVTFLPQSLFMHTYVNPDSLCLLSTAIMLYGILSGYEDGFKIKSCSFLCLGVILCALSYYNAYGWIIAVSIMFIAYFFFGKEKIVFDYKSFLRKALLMVFAVLICISWQFIRNYLLYDGDFIGLTTKENFIMSFGIPRETFYSRGESIFTMFATTSFIPKTIISFLGNYGSCTIYAPVIMYILMILVFVLGFVGLFFKSGSTKFETGLSKGNVIIFNLSLGISIIVPIILLLKYSYTVDYQAQGRYIIPGLLSIMYFVTLGISRICSKYKLEDKYKKYVSIVISVIFVLATYVLTFAKSLPMYLNYPVL